MGWVIDMRHYLDEDTGDLPDELPTPVLNLALFFGSIVAWVIIVADISPLQYLIPIEHVEVLPVLYGYGLSRCTAELTLPESESLSTSARSRTV